MSPLAARNVENVGSRRKPEQVDQSCDVSSILRQVEDRLVLEHVLRIEVRRPPGTRFQKNTGSRYAPNTDSIAARISYSVQ